MWILFAIYGLFLVISSASPAADLAAAGAFFTDGTFTWRDMFAANLLHEFIQYGARALAVALVAVAVFSKLHRKASLFLLVALIIGPGLLTNTVLKDNWGRARPIQVQEFGGAAQYTLPLQPTNQCEKNCSFVSGDGALGLFLHAFFYVVPARLRRRVFLTGFVGGGIIFGGLRIAMGAHFLSDVLWAGVLMLLSTAAVHALFYGKAATRDAWRSIMGQQS